MEAAHWKATRSDELLRWTPLKAAGCADEDAAVHTEATPEVADVQENMTK